MFIYTHTRNDGQVGVGEYRLPSIKQVDRVCWYRDFVHCSITVLVHVYQCVGKQ